MEYVTLTLFCDDFLSFARMRGVIAKKQWLVCESQMLSSVVYFLSDAPGWEYEGKESGLNAILMYCCVWHH